MKWVWYGLFVVIFLAMINAIILFGQYSEGLLKVDGTISSFILGMAMLVCCLLMADRNP